MSLARPIAISPLKPNVIFECGHGGRSVYAPTSPDDVDRPGLCITCQFAAGQQPLERGTTMTDRLETMMQTQLTPPPPISHLDSYDLLDSLTALRAWCAERLASVPPAYRVNSTAAAAAAARANAAHQRCLRARTYALAVREADQCHQHARQLHRDGGLDYERLLAELRDIE